MANCFVAAAIMANQIKLVAVRAGGLQIPAILIGQQILSIRRRSVGNIETAESLPGLFGATHEIDILGGQSRALANNTKSATIHKRIYIP